MTESEKEIKKLKERVARESKPLDKMLAELDHFFKEVGSKPDFERPKRPYSNDFPSHYGERWHQ